MKCPRCQSSYVRKLSIIWAEGTTTQGTSVLAASVAPPQRPPNPPEPTAPTPVKPNLAIPIVAIGLGAVIFVPTVGIVGESPLPANEIGGALFTWLLCFGALPIAWILYKISSTRKQNEAAEAAYKSAMSGWEQARAQFEVADAAWRREMSIWDSKILCDSCGAITALE